MPSIFTKIIAGELPGRFVWKDDLAVCFLTINPIRPGHALVVPRREVDHWLDLDPASAQHMMSVAQAIGRAQMKAFRPTKVGMIIAGLEVPHVHMHVFPVHSLADFDFARADKSPIPSEMDRAAQAIREALRAAGHAEVSD